LFTGGLAGASAVLSLVARLTGRERLARAALTVGLTGQVASPLLLISDLGRPERFLNMLRVFKVTSPLSVGSWILAASGGATTTAAACEALGIAPRLKLTASVASAGAGAPLAVYTATLISNTAVPVWHEARRELPFLFAAESAASAGAAATLLLGPRDSGPARRLAVGGALAAEGVAVAMERRLGFVGEVYAKEEAGRYNRFAKAASLAGTGVLAAAGSRSRLATTLGGALLLAGGLARRWSVFRAGFQSARDPRYTVDPQRSRLSAARS
jgi:hypothetical protein